MTEKLYWSDPHASTFETTGAAAGELGGKPSVVLPRTLFYPEGGGQLGDVGTLAFGDTTVTVIDTQVDDRGVIHHLVGAAVTLDASSPVRGTVEAGRRRDHTVQHTAQHALSRALADVARADTVSARLGTTTCTIDVSRATVPDAELHQAEDLVNALVAGDVEVRALYPTAEELARLPLRKAPKVTEGVVRVIEIADFDLTPCGGTHCTRTGQIGQARIVGLEKHKGMLRITFHAGLRALADARSKHAALAALAADLTCGVADVPGAVAKLRAELKGTRAQLDATRTELVELVAAATLAGLAADAGPVIVLPLLRPNDDVGALRVLAGKLASDPRVVALAGGLDPQTGELVVVVQRGRDAPFDCGAFVGAEARGLPARAPRGGSRAGPLSRCSRRRPGRGSANDPRRSRARRARRRGLARPRGGRALVQGGRREATARRDDGRGAVRARPLHRRQVRRRR